MADATPVRSRTSPGTSSGTSLTVAFEETTPLGADHFLVAVFQFEGTLANVASNSWGADPLSGSASSGSALYLGAVAVQGDGVTNSFTITFTSSRAQIAVALLAFRRDGAAAVSLDGTPAASNNGSGTSAALGPTPATTASKAIHIAATGLSAGGGGTWADYTGGFESLPAQSRLRVAVLATTEAGATPSTSVSWTSARASRDIIWTLPGLAAATEPVDPVDPPITNMRIGADTPEAIYLDGDVVAVYLGNEQVWGSPTFDS